MIVYEELSYRILAACFEVHNILGPGFSENIYENAIARELAAMRIDLERKMPIDIFYKGEKVGIYRLDMVVEGKVILELKARLELEKVFYAQLLSYLKASGLKLGILVNFGKRRVEYKRIVR